MSTPATEPKTEVKPGVRHIIDNTKYPDYIRNHGVFQKLNKIAKVFPSIGLPNCQEECDYQNIQDAKADAQNLLITDVRTALYKVIDSYSCKASLRDIASAIYNEITSYYSYMVIEEEGKINIKFYHDCGVNAEGKPFAKKGEGFFKAYNKFAEKCKEEAGINLLPLDSMPFFKNFSTNNVGGKKFKLIFSSTGEEGAWDIATISMRGISSCQSWGTSQSRGLIGSISSRYVGVIYLTSGDKYNDHGSRMNRRTLVRFAINKKTKKPALLLDRVYPADCPAARKLFKDFLTKKTNLPVLFSNDAGWNDHALPADSYWKFVAMQPGEFTYMDTKIPWMTQQPTPKDPYTYHSRISQVDRELQTRIHDAIVKMADEYCVKKDHADLFKGGVTNLLVSMKRNFGTTTWATSPLPKLYDIVRVPHNWVPDFNAYGTPAEYEKAVVRAAIKNIGAIKIVIKTNYTSMGRWTKYYTKSIDKLVDLIVSQYKLQLLVLYKNLLKN